MDILLYIPTDLLPDDDLSHGGRGYEEESQYRDEIGENILDDYGYAYACIAVLEMIGVPDHLIRYSIQENLKSFLMELYKYTFLSRYMKVSMEEKLRLFQ